MTAEGHLWYEIYSTKARETKLLTYISLLSMNRNMNGR